MFHQPFYKTEAEVSFSNLSRLSQLPTESAEKFIARFKRSKHKCKTNYLESEYIKLAQRGLKMELRKKFQGMLFNDLFYLSWQQVLQTMRSSSKSRRIGKSPPLGLY